MTKPATNLHDAEPAAWRGEKRPDPSPERQRYDVATLKRDGIGRRMREWQGARSGPDYEALVLEWVGASTQADQAFDAMIDAQLRNQAGDQTP